MKNVKTNKLSQIKRQIILDSAMNVFTQAGLEGATIRAIASDAEMSTGAVYSMFEGKEDIYAELLKDSLDALLARLTETQATAQSPKEAVSNAIWAFFDFYAENPHAFQMGLYSFSGLRRTGVGRERGEKLDARLVDALAPMRQAFADAIPDASPGTVSGMQARVFAFLLGTLSMQMTGRDKSLGSVAREIVADFVDDIVADLA